MHLCSLPFFVPVQPLYLKRAAYHVRDLFSLPYYVLMHSTMLWSCAVYHVMYLCSLCACYVLPTILCSCAPVQGPCYIPVHSTMICSCFPPVCSLSGGRGAADGLHEAPAPLHELHHLLRGHALPPPLRLSLSVPPFPGCTCLFLHIRTFVILLFTVLYVEYRSHVPEELTCA
jgi:hypothetical protein